MFDGSTDQAGPGYPTFDTGFAELAGSHPANSNWLVRPIRNAPEGS